jgi:hypothetical protein
VTPDDLATAMALVAVHWPWTMTAAELDTWHRSLRPLDLEKLVDALDSLAASGQYPRFRPTIPVILDAYRAVCRSKAEPAKVEVAPKLPVEITRKGFDEAWAALGSDVAHLRRHAPQEVTS